MTVSNPLFLFREAPWLYLFLTAQRSLHNIVNNTFKSCSLKHRSLENGCENPSTTIQKQLKLVSFWHFVHKHCIASEANKL